MKPNKLVIFKGKSGWRWRCVSSNGKLIGESGGDGYKNYQDALKGFVSIWKREFTVEGLSQTAGR